MDWTENATDESVRAESPFWYSASVQMLMLRLSQWKRHLLLHKRRHKVSWWIPNPYWSHNVATALWKARWKWVYQSGMLGRFHLICLLTNHGVCGVGKHQPHLNSHSHSNQIPPSFITFQSFPYPFLYQNWLCPWLFPPFYACPIPHQWPEAKGFKKS